jgi:hypothetical protein
MGVERQGEEVALIIIQAVDDSIWTWELIFDVVEGHYLH